MAQGHGAGRLTRPAAARWTQLPHGRKGILLLSLGLTLLVAFVAAMLAGIATSLGDMPAVASAAEPDDVVVTKYWDDEGYANRFRPASVTLHLAREDAPDAEVSRLVLTQSDAIADDAWQGTFPSVKKFDDNGDLIPYVVTEDVPEGYIASYDNGYSGYELTFADDAVLANYRNVEISLYHGDEAVSWGDLSEYLPYSLYDRGHYITVPGASGSYYVYPVDGSFTIDKGGPKSYSAPTQWQDRLLTNPNSILSQRYVIDVVGDAYPESVPSFTQLSGYIWRYRHDLGRNTPTLMMVLHNESWGRSGPPLPLLLAFSEIKPVRSPDKPLEVTDTINLRSMPFKKVWDDEGHEDYRPQSVTLDVYQDDGEQPFKTVVVRKTNATDDHIWESAFTDLPRYRADYSEYEYTIVERPVPGYSETTYDSEYYDGVDLTFSADTNVGYGTNYQMLGDTLHSRGMHPYVLGYAEWVDGYPHYHMSTTITGDTLSYAGKEGFFNLEWAPHPMPEQGTFTIASMRRVHLANPEVSPLPSYYVEHATTMWEELQASLRGEGDRQVHEMEVGVPYHPESEEPYSLWAHYKWDDTQPFPGADIIVNHVDLTIPQAAISKVDITGEDEVIGATLTLSEKGGEVIDEWVSGDEPHFLGSDKLELSKTYVLHEKSAPDGYAYATDVEFVAGASGSRDIVRMVDKPTHVSISKVAITGGEELPGASLSLLDASGSVLEEWTSGDKPHEIVGVLVAGTTYRLHEETAPDGYLLASDIEFAVSTDGSVDKVEMVDEAASQAPIDDETEEAGGQGFAPAGEQGGGHGTASDEAGHATGGKGNLLQTGTLDASCIVVTAACLAGGVAYALAKRGSCRQA